MKGCIEIEGRISFRINRTISFRYQDYFVIIRHNKDCSNKPRIGQVIHVIKNGIEKEFTDYLTFKRLKDSFKK